MCANIRRVWVSGFSHSIPTIFQCRQFFLLSFWLKFKVHIMFWVKRLSPRYDYASSFMLFFLFSLLFCFVTMIFWCIFAVFAPSIGILWVVVVVVITSCSWAQSSFLVWYHLSMREKKKFYPLVVRVCVCMCEFVWMYFRRSLFLGKIQVENIIQTALNPNAFSLCT